MKKMFLIASALILTVGVFAQHEAGTLTVQPKIGMNIANYTGSDDTDPRIGLAAGAEFECQLTKMFSLSAGLLYSMQGAKESGTTNGIKVEVTSKTDYINIPIMANIYVVQGLALKMGIQPAFNVNASYTASTQGIDISASLSDFGIEVKPFDFAIPVGLSYEFSNFVIDGRYNIGVTKMVENDDSKNSVFQFTLGYKFNL